MLSRRSFVLAAASVLAAPHARAQNRFSDFPNRPIRFIVPFPPGGGSDVLGRLVGNALSISVGQPVVVENKPGASGLIAAQSVVSAAPDGYTLLIGGSSPMVFNPIFNGANMPYKERDLAAVTILATFPVVIAAKNELPVKSMAELIALAKAKPGALSYGFPATSFQLVMESLLRKEGLKMLSVPYKGGAPAATALMGGEIDLMITEPQSVASLHKTGKMRALAVTSPKRNSLLPDVPTLLEVGLMQDFEVTLFMSVAAPGGTPLEIVRKLHRELGKVLQSPELRSRFAQIGVDANGATPEETINRYRKEIAIYTPIARDLGLIEKAR